MSDRRVIVTGAIVGAAVGALLSHFLMTARGRQGLEQLDRRFDELMREVGRLSQVAGRIARSASDGLQQFQNLREIVTSPSSRP